MWISDSAVNLMIDGQQDTRRRGGWGVEYA